MKVKWLLILGVLVVPSLVTMPGCDTNPYNSSDLGRSLLNENLVCQDPGPHIPVERGHSVELMNPCPVKGTVIDGVWEDLSIGRDSFVIGDCTGPPLGFVNGIRVDEMLGSPTKRSLLAASDAPQGDIHVCYEYRSDLLSCCRPTQGLGHGELFVTVLATAGFKVGVVIPFDAPDGQVSVTVGKNVCLATISTFSTCDQLVPGGTQVLLTAVKFPVNTTKVFWHDFNDKPITCDTTTAITCTFTVTQDISVVPIFL